MEEINNQPAHAVNPSNMIPTYKAKLADEMEARLLAETAVNELLAINQGLRSQLAELQKAKEISDLEFKTELDKLREEVNSLPDGV